MGDFGYKHGQIKPTKYLSVYLYNQMSFLQKRHTNNLKAYTRVAQFLQSKGYDLNNLPKVQGIKPVVQQKERNSNQMQESLARKPDGDESDSQDFDMMAYIMSKNQGRADNQTNKNQPSRNFLKPKCSKEKEQEFNISEYSYKNNNDPSNFEAFQQAKVGSRPIKPIKQKKQTFNSKWKLISKEENANKVKIDQVMKGFESLRCNYKTANNKEWQSRNKDQDHKLYYILSKFPKIKQFKNNQKAIIKCGLEDHNIFVCMPTGGGKSLTFQFLTFLIKGVYLCILPLISLIFDQQYQAKILGIEAYSLTANSSPADTKMVYNKLNNFADSQRSIVIFCTPEKLNLSPAFSEILEKLYYQNFLTRVVIDQVHCVSTWGKEFRAQYQNLSSLKRKFPNTPILALTATVTEVVKQDIIAKLGIVDCYFFQSSFNRPNLYYEVKNKDKNVFAQMEQIIKRFRDKSGIIYCLSRKSCEQVSQQLNNNGFKTAFYHAEIAEQYKKSIQQRWMNNEICIIVATVAFGMGINKPDVRYVIHHSMSKSLENYYQQSGRAGRDGQYSQCILFYRKLDKQFFMSMTLKNDFSTKQSKQFSTKQLAQMIKYCEDKSTCRRQFQLRYLGQTDFNPDNCNKTCDNCRKGKAFLDFECITEAKILINTLQVMEELKISVTKNQFISILKNKMEKNKSIMYKMPQLIRAGINFEQMHYAFEGWKIDEIQTLILEFMSYDLITQKIVENQVYRNKIESSVSNAYLKCHAPRCKSFLEKVQTLAIKREVSNNKQIKNSNFQENQVQYREFDFQERQNLQENTAIPISYLNLLDDPLKQEKLQQILNLCFDDDED